LGTATINNGQVGTIQELELVPPQKNPMRIALDPTGSYLYTTVDEFGFGFFLGIVHVNADGTLGTIVSTDTQICSAQDIAATANGTHTYVYVTCYGGAIELHVVDNTSGAVLSSTSFATAGAAEGMVVDPSGQYLLVADTSINTVDVFQMDPSTGKLGNAFTQTPAGTAPTVLTFDSTGRFVYVADGGCMPLDPAPTCSFTGSGTIQAFSWSGGKLTAIKSYPTGGEPVSLAVFKP
jgi:DNA-binding beta-propeller fold protein YncE